MVGGRLWSRPGQAGGFPILVVGLLLAFSLLGCAAPGTTQTVEPTNLVWPAPPAKTRLVYRRSWRDLSADFRPNIFQKVGELIAGRQRQFLGKPSGLAVAGKERLYVADQDLQGVHVISLTGGKPAFYARAGKTLFVSPLGVAACGKDLAVSDSALRKVFLLDSKGKLLRTIDKPGGFVRPTGLAYDAARGQLYVVDTLASQLCVFDLQGNLIRQQGTNGNDIGQFTAPTHVFIDSQGRVLVSDTLNFRVQVFDRQGGYLFEVGRHGDASGHLGIPKGVGADRWGHIYVVDSYFCTLQIFDEKDRFLLGLGSAGKGPGQFQVPTGLAMGPNDEIYVADSENRCVQVFQYVAGADHDELAAPQAAGNGSATVPGSLPARETDPVVALPANIPSGKEGPSHDARP